MRFNYAFAAVALSTGLMCAPHANATNITGSIYFDGGFSSDGYDPADGGVPPGYGNESSNTVTVGPGVEFGFQDQYNRDTADFSSTGLVLEDKVLSVGASSWQQTFTADTSGYFNGLALVSSSFDPGITYGVSGDTLTVDWDGEYYSGSADFQADFSLPSSVSGAPEPSAWLLMMAGVAGLGMMLRGTKNAGLRLADTSIA